MRDFPPLYSAILRALSDALRERSVTPAGLQPSGHDPLAIGSSDHRPLARHLQSRGCP